MEIDDVECLFSNALVSCAIDTSHNQSNNS